MIQMEVTIPKTLQEHRTTGEGGEVDESRRLTAHDRVGGIGRTNPIPAPPPDVSVRTVIADKKPLQRLKEGVFWVRLPVLARQGASRICTDVGSVRFLFQNLASTKPYGEPATWPFGSAPG